MKKLIITLSIISTLIATLTVILVKIVATEKKS
jgi:hypothetical protein